VEELRVRDTNAAGIHDVVVAVRDLATFYPHVLNRGGRGVESPIDRLCLASPDTEPRRGGLSAGDPNRNRSQTLETASISDRRWPRPSR
jgi:hypothetical protein